MGYKAYGSGIFTLADKSLADITVSKIREYCDIKGLSQLSIEVVDGSSLCVAHNSDWNYHEDDVKTFLEYIKPYVSEGGLVFAGDDDAYWRFRLVNGEFKEENGAVRFEGDIPSEKELKLVSTEALEKELARRKAG